MSTKVKNLVTHHPARHATWLMAALFMLSACANLNPNGSQPKPDLTLTFRDWAIDKDHEEIKAGASSFLLRNQSDRTHEFVMIQINGKPDLPPHTDTGGDSLDEDQFSEEQIVTELEHLPREVEVRHAVHLVPGEYLIFCNIVERSSKGIVNHYGMGMRTTLRVVK